MDATGAICILSAYSWQKEMIYDTGAIGGPAEATEQVPDGCVEVDGVSLRPLCQPDHTYTYSDDWSQKQICVIGVYKNSPPKDLAHVMACWPRLPKNLKRQILALLRHY